MCYGIKVKGKLASYIWCYFHTFTTQIVSQDSLFLFGILENN